MYWVYILLCAGKTLYTGTTPQLERRIKEHNEGKGAKYTRGRRPVVLKQAWVVENRSQALRLEAFIKRFSRQEKEAMIASPEKLLQLAKKKGYEYDIGVLNS
ncbi:MAG: GIY-YIG nuclease family protein [Desulfitobacterium sp.]